MNKIIKWLNDYESIFLGFLLGTSIVMVEKGMVLSGILAIICNILLFIAKYGRLFSDYDNNVKGGRKKWEKTTKGML